LAIVTLIVKTVVERRLAAVTEVELPASVVPQP
jgi:hypothetical protein